MGWRRFPKISHSPPNNNHILCVSFTPPTTGACRVALPSRGMACTGSSRAVSGRSLALLPLSFAPPAPKGTPSASPPASASQEPVTM